MTEILFFLNQVCASLHRRRRSSRTQRSLMRKALHMQLWSARPDRQTQGQAAHNLREEKPSIKREEENESKRL